MHDYIQRLISAGTEQIKKIAALEQRPFTQNTHYLDSNRAKALARLKVGRVTVPVVENGPETKKRKLDALSNMAALGYEGVKEEDLAKLKPPDEYETEMDLMAQVDAYFKVAYKVRLSFILLGLVH